MKRDLVEKFFGYAEVILTMGIILFIVLAAIGIIRTDLFRIEETNLRLHIGLVLFAFFAPRVGGLVTGGIESVVWGLHFSNLFFHRQVIGFIVPVFFIGTIGLMIFFIWANNSVKRVFSF